MKYQEVKTMSEEDKKTKFAELKIQLFKLNLQVSTETAIKKSKQIRELKKDIARILTSFNLKNKKVIK